MPLPPELARLREEALARRAGHDRAAQVSEERAEQLPVLVRGRWYAASWFESACALGKEQIMKARSSLTTRQGAGYRAPIEVKADGKLFAFLDKRYVKYIISTTSP